MTEKDWQDLIRLLTNLGLKVVRLEKTSSTITLQVPEARL